MKTTGLHQKDKSEKTRWFSSPLVFLNVDMFSDGKHNVITK